MSRQPLSPTPDDDRLHALSKHTSCSIDVEASGEHTCSISIDDRVSNASCGRYTPLKPPCWRHSHGLHRQSHHLSPIVGACQCFSGSLCLCYPGAPCLSLYACHWNSGLDLRVKHIVSSLFRRTLYPISAQHPCLSGLHKAV